MAPVFEFSDTRLRMRESSFHMYGDLFLSLLSFCINIGIGIFDTVLNSYYIGPTLNEFAQNVLVPELMNYGRIPLETSNSANETHKIIFDLGMPQPPLYRKDNAIFYFNGVAYEASQFN